MIAHLFRLARSSLREFSKARGRSPRWRATRDAYLAAHPSCAACGSRKRLQVHHVEPFHLRPDLELDWGNLMTLCMGARECHERLGHGGDFRAYCPRVREIVTLLVRYPRNSSLRRRLEIEARESRLFAEEKK